jgi:hypothetical protein
MIKACGNYYKRLRDVVTQLLANPIATQRQACLCTVPSAASHDTAKLCYSHVTLFFLLGFSSAVNMTGSH